MLLQQKKQPFACPICKGLRQVWPKIEICSVDFKANPQPDLGGLLRRLFFIQKAIPEVRTCVHLWPNPDHWMRVRIHFPVWSIHELARLLRACHENAQTQAMCARIADALLQEGDFDPNR